MSIELAKIRTQLLPTSILKPIEVNPPDRTLDKNTASLRIEIEKTHVIAPLLVVVDPLSSKKTHWIVDGHRRFIVAKQLGLNAVYCNIIDKSFKNIADLFVSMNTQLKFSGYQKLWLMRHCAVFFRPVDKRHYTWLCDIGGTSIIDLMIERKNAAPTTANWTKKFCSYLGLWPSKEDIYKVLFWSVDLKQQERARIALDVKYDKRLWIQAIKKHESLPFGAKKKV